MKTSNVLVDPFLVATDRYYTDRYCASWKPLSVMTKVAYQNKVVATMGSVAN